MSLPRRQMRPPSIIPQSRPTSAPLAASGLQPAKQNQPSANLASRSTSRRIPVMNPTMTTSVTASNNTHISNGNSRHVMSSSFTAPSPTTNRESGIPVVYRSLKRPSHLPRPRSCRPGSEMESSYCENSRDVRTSVCGGEPICMSRLPRCMTDSTASQPAEGLSPRSQLEVLRRFDVTRGGLISQGKENLPLQDQYCVPVSGMKRSETLELDAASRTIDDDDMANDVDSLEVSPTRQQPSTPPTAVPENFAASLQQKLEASAAGAGFDINALIQETNSLTRDLLHQASLDCETGETVKPQPRENTHSNIEPGEDEKEMEMQTNCEDIEIVEEEANVYAPHTSSAIEMHSSAAGQHTSDAMEVSFEEDRTLPGALETFQVEDNDVFLEKIVEVPGEVVKTAADASMLSTGKVTNGTTSRRSSGASSQHSLSGSTTGDASKKRPRSPTPSKPDSTPPKRSLLKQQPGSGKPTPSPTSKAVPKSALPSQSKLSLSTGASKTSNRLSTAPKSAPPPSASTAKRRPSASTNSQSAEPKPRPSASTTTPSSKLTTRSQTSTSNAKSTPAPSPASRQGVGPTSTTSAGGGAVKKGVNLTLSMPNKGTKPGLKSATPTTSSETVKSNESSVSRSQPASSRRTSVNSTSTPPIKSQASTPVATTGVKVTPSPQKRTSISNQGKPSGAASSNRPSRRQSNAEPTSKSNAENEASEAALLLSTQLTDQLTDQRARLAHQEARISQLAGLEHDHSAQLSHTQSRLMQANTGLQAMATVVKVLWERIERCPVKVVQAELKAAQRSLEEMTSQIKDLRERKERLIEELTEQTIRHQEELASLNEDQINQSQMIERRATESKTKALDEMMIQHSEEVLSMRETHKKQLEGIASQYETLMGELCHKNEEAIAEMKQSDANHIKELQHCHQEKMSEMTQRFEEMRVTLTTKLDALQEKYDEIRSCAAVSETITKPLKPDNLQILPAPSTEKIVPLATSPQDIPSVAMPIAITPPLATPPITIPLLATTPPSAKLSPLGSSKSGKSTREIPPHTPSPRPNHYENFDETPVCGDPAAIHQSQIAALQSPCSPGRALLSRIGVPQTPRAFSVSPLCSPRLPRAAPILLPEEILELQTALAEYQQLPNEIQSLKAVLEMRNGEITELRRQNNELEQKMDELKEAHKKISQMQYKIENLEAIINLKSDGEKQLQDRYQQLFRKLDQESREKKRLTQDYEELQYRIEEAEFTGAEKDLGEPGEMPNSMTASVVMRGRTSTGGRHIPLHKGLQHDRSKRRTLSSTRDLESPAE